MWALASLVGVVALITLALVRIGTSGQPLSVVDEPAHLDTAFKLHDGGYPHRGSEYGRDLIEVWACGVGHESSGMTVACDSSTSAETLPSGQYTSGYIHYPTYFVGGELFRWAIDPTGGAHGPIDAYRAWSGVLGGAGMLVCLVGAWSLGLRGSSVWAATLVPLAGSGIAFLNTIVNPGAAAVLCGALIAWGGLRWVLSGRGFWLLWGAVALAACTAVTHALPAGAFILAIVAARGGAHVGIPAPDTAWRPRWWQAGALAATVVAPVLVWNRVIEARATVPNEALYGAVPVASSLSVVRGAVEELFTVLTPWIEGQVLLATADDLSVVQVLRAASVGIPLLITVLVLGMLVAAALGLFATPRIDPADLPTARVDSWCLRLVAACTLITMMLYPVALRVSNSFTFGFDYGIVNRYSISFAPLLLLLVLMMVPGRVVSRTLAVLGLACLIGICATAL